MLPAEPAPRASRRREVSKARPRPRRMPHPPNHAKIAAEQRTFSHSPARLPQFVPRTLARSLLRPRSSTLCTFASAGSAPPPSPRPPPLRHPTPLPASSPHPGECSASRPLLLPPLSAWSAASNAAVARQLSHSTLAGRPDRAPWRLPSYPEQIIIGRLVSLEWELRRMDAKVDGRGARPASAGAQATERSVVRTAATKQRARMIVSPRKNSP